MFPVQVVNGRVRAVHENPLSQRKSIIHEFGRSDLIGGIETLEHSTRISSMLAVRDSVGRHVCTPVCVFVRSYVCILSPMLRSACTSPLLLCARRLVSTCKQISQTMRIGQSILATDSAWNSRKIRCWSGAGCVVHLHVLRARRGNYFANWTLAVCG